MSSPIAPADPAADVRLQVALAITSAAVVVTGVMGFGWSVFYVMVLYWIENVLIGVANLCRILVAGARGGVAAFAGSLFVGAFFSVHYGLFTFVHGMFVFSMFGPGATADSMSDPATAASAFAAGAGLDRWLLLAVLVIAVSVLVDLVRWIAASRPQADAVESKRVAANDMKALMAAPYGRVMVLHLTLIFGAMLMAMLDAPAAAAVLLAGLKLAFDLTRLLPRARGVSVKSIATRLGVRVKS